MKTPSFLLPAALGLLMAASLLHSDIPAPPGSRPAAPKSAPSPLQLTVVCDKAEYMHGEPGLRYFVAPTGTMQPTLLIKNTSAQPVTLQFSTAQQYDFIIRDAQGAVVKRWSEGRAFADAAQTLTLKAGEEKSFGERLSLGAVAKPLPVGKYTLEAVLAVKPPLTATASFRIIPTPP